MEKEIRNTYYALSHYREGYSVLRLLNHWSTKRDLENKLRRPSCLFFMSLCGLCHFCIPAVGEKGTNPSQLPNSDTWDYCIFIRFLDQMRRSIGNEKVLNKIHIATDRSSIQYIQCWTDASKAKHKADEKQNKSARKMCVPHGTSVLPTRSFFKIGTKHHL